MNQFEILALVVNGGVRGLIMRILSLSGCFWIIVIGLLSVVQAAEPDIAQAWVLLEGEQAGLLIHQCSRESPEAIRSVWIPSAAVLQKMEAQLVSIEKLASVACCGVGAKVKDVRTYFRQYAGLVIEDRQYIYINALARTEAINNWREKPVMACEGGMAYWGVLYDPSSGKFFDLAFNSDD